MGGFKSALSAGAALLFLAACERPSAVADGGAQTPSSAQAPRTFADTGGGATSGEAIDHRRDPVPEMDGKPMWSSSRRYGAQENAQRAFDRNGEAFGARDLDDFIKKAHAFVAKPPKGAQTLTRTNGDLLIYDPKTNIFAVATRDGAPRTMFKPDDGAAYWEAQKAREASRQARADGSSRSGEED